MKASELKDIIDIPLEELLVKATEARKQGIGNNIEVCGIINAKSGACSEDCKFCAQSAHYSTDILKYPLRSFDKIIESAREAKANGSDKFGIVTSGNRLVDKEIDVIADAINVISQEIGISPCASLGALDESSFIKLKDAGLTRYHHNIETSARFYSEIVSTHDYSERINTVKAARKLGLEVCSGGILGLGETWQDRIDMALLLKDLEVDSVPLNFLVPIPGTPLEGTPKISPIDAIRTIALFRIVLKDKPIKVVAGRESLLKDYQAMIFSAGANGMLVGGYLTISGRSVEEDSALLEAVRSSWSIN